MGTTTADVFSLTLYLTARSKRVHVRKHKRLCAIAVFALNLSPERLLNCSVLVRRKLSLRNLDEQRQISLRYRMTDRQSVVEGKSVSVRVDLGGRRIITNTNEISFNL